jgi:hypothetical protein
MTVLNSWYSLAASPLAVSDRAHAVLRRAGSKPLTVTKIDGGPSIAILFTFQGPADLL